jgi:hypothetical protein
MANILIIINGHLQNIDISISLKKFGFHTLNLVTREANKLQEDSVSGGQFDYVIKVSPDDLESNAALIDLFHNNNNVYIGVIARAEIDLMDSKRIRYLFGKQREDNHLQFSESFMSDIGGMPAYV